MLALMENLSGLELMFVSCAVFGTVLFVIRLILMIVGMGGEGAHSADVGHMDAGGIDAADIHAGGVDAGHVDTADMDHSGEIHDSDLSFKLLSLQGITAFFMMFGLVGWALERSGSIPAMISIAIGTAAGLATIWVMKKIFQVAGKLQSSGTLNLQNAIGQEGQVYLTIHPGQIGKVQIVVQDRMLVLNAMASNGDEEIKTGQRVWVERISAETLIVGKLGS